MPDETIRQMEGLIADLRGEIGRMRDEFRGEISDFRRELGALAAQGAARDIQFASHISRCDERQTRSIEQQRDHDAWARERDEIFKRFMVDSAADRAAIHTAVQAGRTEVREAAIRVQWYVIAAAGSALLAFAGAWLKAYGLHF